MKTQDKIEKYMYISHNRLMQVSSILLKYIPQFVVLSLCSQFFIVQANGRK